MKHSSRRLRRSAAPALLLLGGATIASLLLFVLLDRSPSLIPLLGLQNVRYFALSHHYEPDSKLAFVYRAPAGTSETIFDGDLYAPGYGVEPLRRRYVATSTDLGFRANGSGPPYDVAVIGDSYIEFGEDDSSTLTEMLRAASGRSVFNLGRGWYGPQQYVEVLQRYGPIVRPRIVLLCFFAGNDILDLREYARWLDEGRYYFYEDFSRRIFPERYLVAMRDVVWAVSGWLRAGVGGSGSGDASAPNDLAIVRLGGDDVRMRFRYWSEPGTPDDLLGSVEWQTLRSLLVEFRRLSLEIGATPVLVHLPTKAQVYGRFCTDASGPDVLSRIEEQRSIGNAPAEALARLADESDLPMIDLLPHFQELAAKGMLLYYPFDTHWNPQGRHEAARFLASELQGRW